MKSKVVKVVFILKVSFFLEFLTVQSMTCGELENKIKTYEDEIKSLKISLQEFELVLGKTEDILDVCNESLSCSSCLREKRNSGCGWCVLRNRCSLSKNCPGNDFASDFWISGSDRCPKIRAVIPHSIAASSPRMLQIILPHLPAYDGDFICSFEVQGKTFVTKGKKSDRGITCASPRSTSLPRIPVGDDHMVMKLSVRTPNGPSFASTSNFTVYDCSRYKTCTECADSDYPCSWCFQRNRCTHDAGGDCRNDILLFSKSVTRPTIRQGAGYCTRIASYSGFENEILVPSGSKKRIYFKVENVMMFHTTVPLKCKVKGFPEVPAQLLGDTIYCNDINLIVLGRQPVYNLSFSVFWDGIGELDNPRKMHVVVYYCERMANNCGECIDLPPQYGCGWCEESHSCSIKDHCVDSVWMDEKYTCRRPEITSIYPTSSLATAGTNLTIEGANLAKDFKDIESIMLIDGEGEVITDCLPYEHSHVRHSKVVCLLNTPNIQPENNATLSGFVEIKLSDDLVAISEQEYFFVDPVISGFHPVKGMQSGGTVLKISGFYLDAGNEVEAYIGDLPCHIISRDRFNIRCVSSPLPADLKAPKSGAVRVFFDGEERTSSSYFFYVADPSVHSVKGISGSRGPVGKPSGGDPISVEGANFDYAPNPYLYVFVDGVEYPGACTVMSETRMQCLSPVISAEALNFCEGQGSMSLHYGFKMGDAMGVRNISQNPDNGMYKLYPDPYLLPFSEERKIKTFNSEYLIIQGKYLDNVLDEDDFAVIVGGEECRMTSLSHTQLTCRVPEVQQSDDVDEDKLPEVHVKISGGLEYFIGFLRREKG